MGFYDLALDLLHAETAYTQSLVNANEQLVNYTSQQKLFERLIRWTWIFIIYLTHLCIIFKLSFVYEYKYIGCICIIGATNLTAFYYHPHYYEKKIKNLQSTLKEAIVIIRGKYNYVGQKLNRLASFNRLNNEAVRLAMCFANIDDPGSESLNDPPFADVNFTIDTSALVSVTPEMAALGDCINNSSERQEILRSFHGHDMLSFHVDYLPPTAKNVVQNVVQFIKAGWSHFFDLNPIETFKNFLRGITGVDGEFGTMAALGMLAGVGLIAGCVLTGLLITAIFNAPVFLIAGMIVGVGLGVAAIGACGYAAAQIPMAKRNIESVIKLCDFVFNWLDGVFNFLKENKQRGRKFLGSCVLVLDMILLIMFLLSKILPIIISKHILFVCILLGACPMLIKVINPIVIRNSLRQVEVAMTPLGDVLTNICEGEINETIKHFEKFNKELREIKNNIPKCVVISFVQISLAPLTEFMRLLVDVTDKVLKLAKNLFEETELTSIQIVKDNLSTKLKEIRTLKTVRDQYFNVGKLYRKFKSFCESPIFWMLLFVAYVIVLLVFWIVIYSFLNLSLLIQIPIIATTVICKKYLFNFGFDKAIEICKLKIEQMQSRVQEARESVQKFLPKVSGN